MIADLSRPEPYLFAFFDRGETFAVRILAFSHEAARAAFDAMSAAEKRARVVARLSKRERDVLGDWFRSLRERFT